MTPPKNDELMPEAIWVDHTAEAYTDDERIVCKGMVKYIRADIAAQGEDGGWRTMESAPRDGTYITGIWWSGNITHGFPFVCRWHGERWETPDSKGAQYNGIFREPSHWSPIIPLPAPPVIGER